jgi:dihydroxy-acid dehydratase
VGHVVPEAQVGGPIALVQDGDIITIDAEANTLDVNISEEEFATRKANWVAPPLRPKKGALLKYARNVTDASRGCGKSCSLKLYA